MDGGEGKEQRRKGEKVVEVGTVKSTVGHSRLADCHDSPDVCDGAYID